METFLIFLKGFGGFIAFACVVYFFMYFGLENIVFWIFISVVGSGIVYGILKSIYEKFFVKEEKVIELPQEMKEDE